MTDTNPAKFKKLVTLLRELFQLDQPDLDFGIYRIMHAKAGEVTRFLERDLLPQVKDAFAQHQSADSAELKKKLEQLTAQITEAGMNPEDSPKVRELREQLKGAIDLGALENETYDHLYSFFRRYYSDGDFLAKRVYKPGVYAIPYEGEEVTLHWANKDQYYIKTSEYLRDYAFRLKPEAAEGMDPMRVHFKLVDAAEGEHGNVKAAEGKDRVFVLAAEDCIGLENGELALRFEYRPATLEDWPADQREGKKKPPAQKELSALAVSRILASGGDFADWLAQLKRPHIKTDGEQADYTRLEAHLRRYTARNTFDYFIHKDLGGFLRRELDFYIKNEVMHLDDVESETAAKVEQYLSKIKVIRRIAGKIIDFLAQLENFQKKLWLKKKFVVGSDWLVAISQVPDELLPEVCANDAQLEEWKTLHSLHELPADVTRPAYSEPLTPEYLRALPSLMVDTRHFDAGFSSLLLEVVGELDGKSDGLLVHSENFQALSFVRSSLSQKIKCVYVDPPYNTELDRETGVFLYKDSYPSSTWLALVAERLSAGRTVLADDGAFICSIDDNELPALRLAMDSCFGRKNFISSIAWKSRDSVSSDHKVSLNHNYHVVYAREMQASSFGGFDLDPDDYKNPDNDERGPWKLVPIDANKGGGDTRYGIENPSTGVTYFPPNGRSWAFNPNTYQGLFRDNRIMFGLGGESAPKRKLFLRERQKDGDVKTPVSIWSESETTKDGTQQIVDLFGSKAFAYPKPVGVVFDLVKISHISTTISVLDYFAGSGTTGHAVIALNRQDGGGRSFTLVEAGRHFGSILVPRMKKVVFTPEWKDGKPKRLATGEEAERSPRLIKVLRLESYEDTLNNLAMSRSTQQQSALDFNSAQGADGLREHYLLRYQLDVESSGSASLLNITAFADPTAYTLRVKTPGSDESREVNVDLLETFNWLLGLTVQHIAAPRSFSAAFERDSEGRLQLKGRLKQDAAGPWWFRTVTGTTPEGRKTLVIWRKLTGEAEQDNLVLETWFRDKQAFSVKDTEFDLIYVNGDSTLENLRLPDETWKVRLTEEDFQRLMFEGTES